MGMGLEFCVLGPLRAWRDGHETDLGRPQQRAVLAALLLAPGQLVPLGQLIDGLWGEDDAQWPKNPVGQLSTHTHRLRRAMAAPGDPGGEVLVAESGGYRLNVDRRAVDLFHYDAAVLESAALRHDDPVRARALLREALGRWRGPALDGVPGVLAERTRHRLAAGRHAVTKTLLDIELTLGRHAELLPELGALAAENPHDEEVQRLYVLALHRGGRTDEALAAFDALRERLDRELGLEPSPAMIELHTRIRDGDPALTAAPAPAPPRRPARPGQLPPDIPDWVGRGAELREAEGLLRQPDTSPVLALSGPRGSGTSAFAVHLAHAVQDAYPDGQLYVSPYVSARGPRDGAAAEPRAVLAAFLRALGERPPDTADTGELSRRYRAALAGRRVLVLLDGVARPEPLLPATPGCAAVLTGAAPDALPTGAAHIRIGPLEPDDAHELLARVAGADRVREEPGPVAELAALCGHLPLHLRAAATRLAARPHWSVAGLVARTGRDQ
ncbi:winged helix-turn-helix domain-containing protein [Streptomyces sp. NBC_00536]|uniref:AfsR/SARP family transcriptional regulator n=1 Tax=Streptomyces sp. NBC_00536 TaxID=2975769 RepID=UPI002E801DAA|nr:BTAD domain-containing putative transcriptional regulator [Streptomyces sp. NBC_00536]WUC79961.1 winged helix-turn-helix domain-containing protein [Streptomyces sp. NBC_00536]